MADGCTGKIDILSRRFRGEGPAGRETAVERWSAGAGSCRALELPWGVAVPSLSPTFRVTVPLTVDFRCCNRAMVRIGMKLKEVGCARGLAAACSTAHIPARVTTRAAAVQCAMACGLPALATRRDSAVVPPRSRRTCLCCLHAKPVWGHGRVNRPELDWGPGVLWGSVTECGLRNGQREPGQPISTAQEFYGGSQAEP
jgi:hypothetical protein